MAPVDLRLYYGTCYLGVPKRDPDFGNYPYRENAEEHANHHANSGFRASETYKCSGIISILPRLMFIGIPSIIVLSHSSFVPSRICKYPTPAELTASEQEAGFDRVIPI